jgi:hypothetical protein
MIQIATQKMIKLYDDDSIYLLSLFDNIFAIWKCV